MDRDTAKRRITFLVIEDNELDLERIERNLKKLRVSNPIITATDGMEALEKLKSGQVPKPNIILLDLNMPRMNGFEFLEQLRQNPKLSDSPIFVLTTSDHEADVAQAQKYNVAGYIIKPISRSQMSEALETMNAYWELCEFPNE